MSQILVVVAMDEEETSIMLGSLRQSLTQTINAANTEGVEIDKVNQSLVLMKLIRSFTMSIKLGEVAAIQEGPMFTFNTTAEEETSKDGADADPAV